MLLLITDYRLSLLKNTNSLCVFLFSLITDESADNRYLKVSNKLVSARLPRTLRPIFSSFLIFCFEKLEKY